MNKQIQILYKIFELELTPPFKLIRDDDYPHADDIFNKHSEKIGWYDRDVKCFHMSYEKDMAILKKIKQVFGINRFSGDQLSIFEKQLSDWLQDKFPEKVLLARFIINANFKSEDPPYDLR